MHYLVVEKSEQNLLKTCGHRFDSPIGAIRWLTKRRHDWIKRGYLVPYYRENRTVFVTDPDTGEVISTIQVKQIGV